MVRLQRHMASPETAKVVAGCYCSVTATATVVCCCRLPLFFAFPKTGKKSDLRVTGRRRRRRRALFSLFSVFSSLSFFSSSSLFTPVRSPAAAVWPTATTAAAVTDRLTRLALALLPSPPLTGPGDPLFSFFSFSVVFVSLSFPCF